MSYPREKTVSYRRAEWIVDSGRTLETYVKEANRKLASVAAKTVIYGAHHVRIAKLKEVRGGGVLLHITAEIPGDATSVVPKIKGAESEIELRRAAPPSDGEWLSGDAFLFVKDDHVCMCTTDIHDGAVQRFIHLVFERAGLRSSASQFVLRKQADIGAVNLLRKEGVKELSIRATLYKATADYQRRKNNALGVAGVVGKHFKAVLGTPHDVTHDSLRMELVLKADKRFGRGDIKVGEKQIERLAVDVINNFEPEDEFVILTRTGQKITQKEIFIRAKVMIDSDGKTVNCDQAWQELRHFFVRLHETGALEE